MSESAGRRVLFLCTGNSARSQMAEGFLRHLAGDVFEVYSAGIKPRPVHPLSVEVMKEVGIDISGQTSKGLDALRGVSGFLFLIIVCTHAERHCPATFEPAAMRLVWPFADPVRLEASDMRLRRNFCKVRDAIRSQIVTWLKDDIPQAWFTEKRWQV
jgi:arsenate reductase